MNVRWSVWKENGHVHTHMIIGSVKKSRCKHQQVSSLFVILSKSRYWYLYVLLSFSDGGFKVILHIAHVIVLHTHTHFGLVCSSFLFCFCKKVLYTKVYISFSWYRCNIFSYPFIYSKTVEQRREKKLCYVCVLHMVLSLLCNIMMPS